jgi:RimJ/RimL family protein N-acetyltransferase
MQYSIQKLEEKDWRVFSEIRLRALQTDPTVFGSTYDVETKFEAADWKSRLSSPDSAVFAVFDNNRPVGMTGVGVDRNDPTKRTALFWGSWLEPDARCKGISMLLYEARIEWAKQQPGVERIIVSHRESNLASKFANQKFGFVPTHETEKVWNDGITEKEFHYELILK